jgi:hypothetical protein
VVQGPDNPCKLTFTVTAGVPGAITITSGPPPNGTYTIEVGIMPGANSEYVALITPVGVAEMANFQSGDL